MESNIREYKCPCCGGAIEFDTNLQKMKCPFCDTEFELESLVAYDEVLNKETNGEMEWDNQSASWDDKEQNHLRVYVCSSCGGEIIGDSTLAATKCPFCDSPVIIMDMFKGILKPDFVIPFQLDRNQAKESFLKHLSKKRLLPKTFKEETHIDEIKGIYVPYWLFSANANGSMRFRTTRVHTWRDSRFLYTETRHFSVLREGNMNFSRVPSDGSSKMNDELMESLEPFDFSKATDFQTAYLAGFFADKYDVTFDQVKSRINERIKSTTEDALRDTVQGYATVVSEDSQVSLKNGIVKYALYPVWLLNTTWKDEKYVFAMNGQSGKFVGNLPCDKGAFCRWLFGLTGIISAVIFGLIALAVVL